MRDNGVRQDCGELEQVSGSVKHFFRDPERTPREAERLPPGTEPRAHLPNHRSRKADTSPPQPKTMPRAAQTPSRRAEQRPHGPERLPRGAEQRPGEAERASRDAERLPREAEGGSRKPERPSHGPETHSQPSEMQYLDCKSRRRRTKTGFPFDFPNIAFLRGVLGNVRKPKPERFRVQQKQTKETKMGPGRFSFCVRAAGRTKRLRSWCALNPAGSLAFPLRFLCSLLF